MTSSSPPTQVPRLVMHGIVKSFPGTRALDGADLEVAAGEVHCLLGENGAGKSTLMKILSGAYRADAGTITLEGVPQHHSSPSAAMAAGISVIYQELDLVPDLTVAQNLFLGRAPTFAGVVRRRERTQSAGAALDLVGGRFAPSTLVRELSVGDQQLAAIAKAVVTDARVIVMDEPSATLTEHDLPRVFDLIRRLTAEGRSVVYISHRLDEVLEIGDRATVLRDGRTVARFELDSAAGAVDAEDLVTAMIGHRPDSRVRGTASFDHCTPRLRLDRVQVPGLIDVSDVVVRPGEVVGLAGLGGAGRSTLLRAVFGSQRGARVSATIDGRTFAPTSPAQAVKAGIGLVPEDRKGEGLLRELSVVRNAGLASLTPASLRPGRRSRRVTAAPLRDLAVRYADLDQPVGQLSGGNQQKVVLAKWLTRGVEILLLDEPTRGIDVGAKEELYRQVRALAEGGTAVLMASSELGELCLNADVVHVMFEGRNIARFDPRTHSEEEIARAVVTGKAAG
ncbi:MAG: transporter ATP-binding protein [Marmoricola sp.]|nr:transporter ATP-binding protein [Marmoricola sp.]